MHGNTEFLVLFIPFLAVGMASIYGGMFIVKGFWTSILLYMIGFFCLAIDFFALLVQYVNWRYYNE